MFNTLFIDVYVDGRFYHTIRFKYSPLFVYDEQEIQDFVVQKLPTLRNTKLNLVLS